VPEQITSRKNETVRHAVRLSSSAEYRRKTGLFLAEGARLCADAVQSGVGVDTLFYTARAQEKYGDYLNGILPAARQAFEVEPHVAELLAGTQSTQGIFCICDMPRRAAGLAELKADRHCLALEAIQDPANLGAVLRTAEALGIGGVVLAGNCCDIYSPKVLRASMGAVFRLPFYLAGGMADAAAQMNRMGFATLAAVPDASAEKITECDFLHPSVIAVGNEGNGLTEEAIAACSRRVTIPMAGRAESLNASASAAILMWEMMRGQSGGADNGR
jgi:rRNA methylases